MIKTPIIVLLGLLGFCGAHMQMKYPAPFRSKFNSHAGYDIDYDMTAPLRSDGSDFPCKGYVQFLGTPEGAPVARWVPGQTYNMLITGGATHRGGSCQASVSFDRGSSWKVLHSYIGNCPFANDASYDFTLPSETPDGEMLFAWTWFNNMGNREMYMNCASIIVEGDGEQKRNKVDPLGNRPPMFIANVGNGICTFEGKDVEFPEPGTNVTKDSQNTHRPGEGDCLIFGGE